MKKAIWKKTIAAGAVLMSLGVVCPVASLHAEEAEAPHWGKSCGWQKW